MNGKIYQTEIYHQENMTKYSIIFLEQPVTYRALRSYLICFL